MCQDRLKAVEQDQSLVVSGGGGVESSRGAAVLHSGAALHNSSHLAALSSGNYDQVFQHVNQCQIITLHVTGENGGQTALKMIHDLKGSLTAKKI